MITRLDAARLLLSCLLGRQKAAFGTNFEAGLAQVV